MCPSCHAVEPLSRSAINLMKQEQPVPCSACGRDQLRFKVASSGLRSFPY